MKKLILILSIGFLLASFSFLSAQSPGWTPWRGWDNYASTLNLTPDQLKKFETLYQNFIKEINLMENHLTSKSLELRTLLLAPLPDRAAIISKQKEMSAQQQKLQQKMLDYRLDALNILSTEQILLLPSDCCLGFTPGRGYGMGMRYGYGPGFRSGYGMGFNRGFGRGRGMGRGVGFYNGRGRGMGLRGNGRYYPFRRR